MGSYSVSDGEIGEFEKPKLAINFSSNDNTKGTVTGENLVEIGENVTLTATPEDGFNFLFWKDNAGNVVSNTAEFTFEASEETAAKQYKAFFIRNYTDNEVHGAFTVNADGKMVAFAKGNLYANVVFGEEDQSAVAQSVTSYGFEAEQWYSRLWSNGVEADLYDNDNSFLEDTLCRTPAGTVGTFYWSKDEKIACSKIYLEEEISENDVFFASNLIINEQEWYTLSLDEWNYLFNSRPFENRYSLCSCNNLGYMLIFPDGWKIPEWFPRNGKYVNDSGGIVYSCSNNKLTTEQLITLNDMGVVILPGVTSSSQVRSGVQNPTKNAGSYYWTPTLASKSSEGYSVRVQDSPHIVKDLSRGVGLKLRLVSEIK